MRQQFHLSVENARRLRYNELVMKLLKVGMFSLGLAGGVATTFAGKDCCCCDASCKKEECHKKGYCSCCCEKYGKCDKKCDKGWFKKECRKACKKEKPQKRHFDKKDKSVIKTIDLKDQK